MCVGISCVPARCCAGETDCFDLSTRCCASETKLVCVFGCRTFAFVCVSETRVGRAPNFARMRCFAFGCVCVSGIFCDAIFAPMVCFAAACECDVVDVTGVTKWFVRSSCVGVFCSGDNSLAF